MDGEVCMNVHVTKLLANSRDPFVVETTTTTTTTTVTKRICVSKDANIDLTDIQSLLDANDNPKTDTYAISNETAFNDSAKQPQNSVESERATDFFDSIKLTSNDKQNKSIFSSTLIGVDRASDVHNESSEKLKKNYFAKSQSKNTFDESEKTDRKMAKTRVKPSTRSKKTDDASKDKDKDNYIDGLINQYMTLEKSKNKKPANKVTNEKKKKEQKEPKEPKKPVETKPEFEPKDLSAIMETSTECVDTPVYPISPAIPLPAIEFDGITNDDYNVLVSENQSEWTNSSVMPTEDKENNRKRKAKAIADTNSDRRVTRQSKKTKESKKPARKTDTMSEKCLIPSKQTDENNANKEQSPIKIYSPSIKGKFRRTTTDSKLILTKKMIEKKLQNHLSSSKDILGRMGRSNELVVDPDSRLIFYPKKNDELEETSDEKDFLFLLQKKSKPLLIKEIE